MKYLKFIFSIIFVFLVYNLVAQKRERNNVIVILIDDLGWSDIGCYGNTINETPNLDKFFNSSFNFTNAYAAAPICSPTRAAILTGKSPARLHFEFVTKKKGSKIPDKPLIQPSYPIDLSLEENTIAESIEKKYNKGFYGKWHLTQKNDYYLGWGNTYGPLQQGFDVGSEDFGNHPYNYNDSQMESFRPMEENGFAIDSLTEKVKGFINDNKSNPFFLYWSFYYVHTPVKTRDRNLYDKYERKLGKLNPKLIEYAAFVETMDHYIGEVLNEIEALDLEENTWVIITSDNGGHPGYTDNFPLKGSKWNLYEGGIRVPFMIKPPLSSQFKPRVIREPIISMDILPTVLDLTGSESTSSVSDGLSLMPLLKGSQNKLVRSHLVWHFPFYHPPINYEGTKPSSAIRKDDFKLIYFYENDETELYNIKTDISEKHNLSQSLPTLNENLKETLIFSLKNMNARFPKAKK